MEPNLKGDNVRKLKTITSFNSPDIKSGGCDILTLKPEYNNAGDVIDVRFKMLNNRTWYFPLRHLEQVLNEISHHKKLPEMDKLPFFGS